MKQYVHLKDGVNCEDLLMISPLLGKMLFGVSLWCMSHAITCEVSSIHRPDDSISESKTHQTFRAFDLSLKSNHGWNDIKIREFVKYIETEYMDIGAISHKTGESRPIYIHRNKKELNGKVINVPGFHAHLQVRPLDYYLKTK